jgi:hypothetical protein
MITAFRSTLFWRIYLLLEENSVDHDWANEELYYLLLDFKEHFPIIKETEGYEAQTVYFNFCCRDIYQLQIEFTPDVFGGDTYIYLLKEDEKFLLGWSDHAHWHPYFIRIEELEMIAEYVKKFDSKWVGSDIPFLLLFSFLCVTDDETGEYVKKKIKVLFNTFNPALEGMVENDFHFVYKTHNDYHWHLNADLDWIVLGGQYGAYTLRNKLYEEHQKFPFEEWKGMINIMKKALKNN